MKNGLEGVFQTIINSFQKPQETIKDLGRTDSEIEDKEGTLLLFFIFYFFSYFFSLLSAK